jgi:alpha-galactosidase
MIGANLTKSDAWTASLLTNPEVIAVDQHSKENRPVISTASTVVWTARPESGNDRYIAIFNLEDHEQKLGYAWKDLELPEVKYKLRNMWDHNDLGTADSLSLTLAPHGCILYRLSQ